MQSISRRVPLGRRILIANFIMVIVPVALLIGVGALLYGVGALLYGVFGMFDGAYLGEVSRLFPKWGPVIVTEYALSEIAEELEDKKPDWQEIQTMASVLESQGLQVAVFSPQGAKHATAGIDPAMLRRQLEALSTRGILLRWEGGDVLFVHHSPRGNAVFAQGRLLLHGRGDFDRDKVRRLWLAIRVGAFVLLAGTILLIILLGRYVARSLTRQILAPLEAIREAAGEISRGKLDRPLALTSRNDELGEACRDIEKMRRDLLAAKEERERYEANRKELLAGISHDLATPLTSIKGYASGILDGIAATEEKRRHYLTRIATTASTMQSLVEELFLFSKLDLGRLEFHTARVNLSAWLADFTGESRVLYEGRGLAVDYEGEPSVVVSLDSMQFARVVQNILSNSAKYGAKKIAVRLWREEGLAELSFTDDGKGVAASDLGAIFESFYRTDKARSDTAKGSGLGLAIARKIIEGLGGRIWAEKPAERGLAIRITLPLVESAGRKDGEQ